MLCMRGSEHVYSYGVKLQRRYCTFHMVKRVVAMVCCYVTGSFTRISLCIQFYDKHFASKSQKELSFKEFECILLCSTGRRALEYLYTIEFFFKGGLLMICNAVEAYVKTGKGRGGGGLLKIMFLKEKFSQQNCTPH